MSLYVNHPSSVVDDGATIGEGTHIWHFSHICSQSVIGIQCTIGQNVFVANNVIIGNHVKIQNNVSIYEGVTLEDYVFCGPSVVFTNVKFPRSAFPRNTSADYFPTLVKSGATIGANATIICGITVGRWSFVAAGAVVTKDIPDYALVAGVPAKQIGWACKCGHQVRLSPQQGKCENCKINYVLENNCLTAMEYPRDE